MRVIVILLLPLLSGCYLTQAGAIKELSEQRTARYQAHLSAQSDAVASIVEALKSMDRGGMTLTLTDDGRVQSISYTEPLNVDALTRMSQTQAYQEEPVKGVLEEVGDFVMKATNLAVPFASIYYGHKNHTETQRANVSISDSNNQANTAMWGSFTNGYQNVSETTTSVIDTNTSVIDTNTSVIDTNTSVTDTSTDRDYTEIRDSTTETTVNENDTL